MDHFVTAVESGTFLRPKGYDTVNEATHEYKEEIKVGYNLRRKFVLMAIWAASPLVLDVEPTCSAFSGPISAPGNSFAASDKSGSSSVFRAWSSGRCSCSSFATSRRDWSGQPRSSPTRFTTSSSTTRRLFDLLQGDLIDDMMDPATAEHQG